VIVTKCYFIVTTEPINPIIRSRTRHYSSLSHGHVTTLNLTLQISLLLRVFAIVLMTRSRTHQLIWTKLQNTISSRRAAMVWPWGGHNDDVATVAMMERPLGPVKVTLQEKKTMTMKSYKLFTVLNHREMHVVSCHTCSVLTTGTFWHDSSAYVSLKRQVYIVTAAATSRVGNNVACSPVATQRPQKSDYSTPVAK
jgi:hypothetical protein